MSSTLFGRGTFLQTGNKQRQDQLDKQNAELRSFAVAATQEIQTLKAAMELVVQRLDALEKRLLQSQSQSQSLTGSDSS